MIPAEALREPQDECTVHHGLAATCRSRDARPGPTRDCYVCAGFHFRRAGCSSGDDELATYKIAGVRILNRNIVICALIMSAAVELFRAATAKSR